MQWFYVSLVIVMSTIWISANAFSRDADSWQADAELVKKMGEKQPEFNYDESKVPHYTLPDPLILSDGTAVTSAQQWTEVRRGELLELFRENVYGRRPTTHFTTEFVELSRQDNVMEGLAIGRNMKAIIHVGERQFEFPFTVFVPSHATGKSPAIVLINNRTFISVEKAIEGEDSFWPVKTIIENGFATATFFTSDVDPDDKNGYAQGVRSFFAEGQPPEDNAWRSLSAWGWGASRVLDYLTSLDSIDASRVTVVGHSRGGKTALWAAAEDPRFAIAYSNNSGCGGAALSRRAYGETVARITSVFPHWFCKPFADYGGNEENLPVDQHELIALVAPRAVYVTSADSDLWADPKGEYASLIAAAPVFGLLGIDSITQAEMPGLDQQRVVGKTGYHIRRGGHGLELQDWQLFLQFAKPVLRAKSDSLPNH